MVLRKASLAFLILALTACGGSGGSGSSGADASPTPSDKDFDGIADTLDAFPDNNAASKDADGDNLPDEWNISCDEFCQTNSGLTLDLNLNDFDNDGHEDGVDHFPQDPSEWQDTDQDSIGNNTDAFPEDNAASLDADRDGFPDEWNASCDFECQNNSDLDLDEKPEDLDNDGYKDHLDIFPQDPSEWSDEDEDGVGDNGDSFPSNAAASLDADKDGLPEQWNDACNKECQDNSGLILDQSPEDFDNDGYKDISDHFPRDSSEWIDSDNDGVGNNSDAFANNIAASVDSDGDGLPDEWNQACNVDCQNTSGLVLDQNLGDFDNDGVIDTVDIFPLDPSEWADQDEDGIGDNGDAFPTNRAASVDADEDDLPDEWNLGCDFTCSQSSGLVLDQYLNDSDNDGHTNQADAFPLDPNEHLDTDGDKVGNNEDLNDDGDQLPDDKDPAPLLKNNEYILLSDAITNNSAASYSVTRAWANFGNAVNGVGDINNDGFADVMVAAKYGAANGQSVSNPVYILKGGSRDTIKGSDFEPLTTKNVLRIIDQVAGKYKSANVGDINGDKIDDLVIAGATYRDKDNRVMAGKTYIFFGNSNWSDITSVANADVVIDFGLLAASTSGVSISSAGDFNGDTINDIVIAIPGQFSGNGRAYMLYGQQNWPSVINAVDGVDFTLNANQGMMITGTKAVYTNSYGADYQAAKQLGSAVASGDFNKDGLSDLLIGAPEHSTNVKNSGAAYILFGTRTPSVTFDLGDVNGTNGVYLSPENNARHIGQAGLHVAAGDLNNDGFDDVVVSEKSNVIYIVYGKETWSKSQTLYNQSRITTNGPESLSGVYSGCDINNDGIDDLVAVNYILYGANDFSSRWNGNPDLIRTQDKLNGTYGVTLSATGFASGCAGDLDLDGFDDMAWGNSYSNQEKGVFKLLFGF